MGAPSELTPTLRVVSGPNSGRLFPLGRDLTTIGRAADCDIVFDPITVSRRHAVVERRGDGYVVRDLKSHGGTLVDGRPAATPLPLREGSIVQITDIELAFSHLPVDVRDEDESTIHLTLDTVTALAPPTPAAARPDPKLRAVLEIGRALGSTLELGEVLERTLAALFDVFPQAGRGFVALREGAGDELTTGAARTRSGPAAAPRASRTILRLALGEGRAVLGEDVPRQFEDAHSLAAEAIRSLICAPLLDHGGRPIGVIQLDTREARHRFGPDDLDLLVAVAGPIGLGVENARLHAALVQREGFERELAWASRVHRALLKRRDGTLPGYAFWDYFQPARHVGGDYFGYFPLGRRDGPDRRWALVVADVSGKGMAAALLMANLAAEVGSALAEEADPARAVARINRRLCAIGVEEMFVTFLLAVLDAEAHRLSVVNAGHPPPLIRRAGGGLVAALTDGDFRLPLAHDPDEAYHAVEADLAPGDVVALFTDGVTEAKGPGGRLYGEDALAAALAAAPPDPLAAGPRLLDDLRRHVAGADQSDDIALICFGRDPDATDPPHPRGTLP